MTRSTAARLALAVVLVYALGLRLWPAFTDLDPSRHYDERFGFDNVRSLLVDRSIEPRHAFYPSLSYVPHTGFVAASQTLHEWTGIDLFEVLERNAPEGFTPTAYLLARTVSLLAGLLSLWVTYRLGARIAGPWTGVLAAFFLASTLSHIQHSALFKPDILVVLFSAVALLWSLEAALEPSLRRYAAVGAAIGLAMSAKYTGINAALPIAVVAGVAGWRDRRHWRGLVGAGAVSIVLFVALNPSLGKLFEYLPRILDIYASKGAAEGGSHLAVVGRQARFLVGHHGIVVAAAALLGSAVALRRLTGAETSETRRLGAALLLAHSLGYSTLYALTTTLFRGQNYLPVSISVAVLAGWAAVWSGRRLGRGLHGRAVRFLLPAAFLLLVAAVAQRPLSSVYHTEVPRTIDRAAAAAVQGLDHLDMRSVYFERHQDRQRLPTPLPMAVPAERLSEIPPLELDLADAEIFPSARLEGEEGADYMRRLLRPGARARRIGPRFLASHGPGLVVLRHPWRLRERERLDLEPRPGRRWVGRIRPPLERGEALSLELSLRFRRPPPRPLFVEVDGTRIWLAKRTPGWRARYTSLRFRSPVAGPRLVLEFGGAAGLDGVSEAILYRWTPP